MPLLTPAGHILDASTLALWRLDDTAPTLSDETGNYPLSSVSGSPQSVTGRVGGSRAFHPPTESYIQSPLSPLAAWQNMVLAGNWTVEQWLWMDPAHVNGSLISFEGGGGQPYGLLLNIGSGGQITYFPGATTLCAALPGHQFSTWEHVAIRSTAINATQARFDVFFQGVKIATVATVTIPTVLPTGPFLCLGSESSGFNTFNGRIDDTRVSKVARTDADIFESYRRGVVGVAADAQGLIVHDTAHATEAVARYLQQYKDKAAFGKLLSALGARAQAVEDALWGVLNYRALSSSSGTQLDNLGKILNLARGAIPGGTSDELYRKWLKAQILVLTSNGTIPDLDAIFSLISDPGTVIQVAEFAPASIVIRLSAAAQSQGAALVAIAQLAKAAGVYCTVDYLAQLPPFGFDGSTGFGFETGFFGGSV